MTDIEFPKDWPESPARHQARAVMASIAADDSVDIEQRIAVLYASTALEDYLPPGWVTTSIDVVFGATVGQAWDLLQADLASDPSVPDRCAAVLALRHLRPWVPDR